MSESEVPLPLWLIIISCLILLFLSGMFSGLNLGLLGLDKNRLIIAAEAASPKEKKYAASILPLRRKGNLLLCTLLVSNVGVNAALSILTADITTGLLGFLISTTAITIIGEIVPQALVSRHALLVGAYCAKFIRVLEFILYPVVKPLSYVLDKMLGQEVGITYSKDELKKLIEIQENQELEEEEDVIEHQTGQILRGALDFNARTVVDIMIPWKQVFKLDIDDTILDFFTVSTIFKNGYSRIPCVKTSKEGEEVKGLLFAKDLVVIDPHQQPPLATVLEIFGRTVPLVPPNTKLGYLLERFRAGRGHLAVVTDSLSKPIGIITIEDIIEEILQAEIIDETDIFIEVEKQKKVPGRELLLHQIDLSVFHPSIRPKQLRRSDSFSLGVTTKDKIRSRRTSFTCDLTKTVMPIELESESANRLSRSNILNKVKSFPDLKKSHLKKRLSKQHKRT